MQEDTRLRNTYFDRYDISFYLQEYAGMIAASLNKVDVEMLKRAQKALDEAHKSGSRVFVGGNGGSAAITDHWSCDFTKGISTDHALSLDLHSLCGHHALFTAIANDLGYEHTFSYQLQLREAYARDLLILISSSGDSANIVEAARYAKNQKMIVIGLTGFSGGKLKELADISLHIPCNNYGVVEDCHQALMHVLAQFHYLSRAHEE